MEIKLSSNPDYHEIMQENTSRLIFIFKIVVADDLVTSGVRASAAMVLTYWTWCDTPIVALEWILVCGMGEK